MILQFSFSQPLNMLVDLLMLYIYILKHLVFLYISSRLSPILYDAVELLLYAPNRPVVDLTTGFLLLMAVGTVVVASLWSELTDPDQASESYSILAKVNIFQVLVWCSPLVPMP